ncbi:uncharacterized protein LOC141878360 [Acropora palmata]|uniref:uncharacterized protein LOC141878360 n=1 Tax=Acropora palmata TaxID=6131 RepID=UPI003DA0B23F
MPTGDEQGNRMSSDRGKQELQQALLDLLREDPDILNNVVRQTACNKDEKKQESPSASGNSYQWQTSDSDDEIDRAWPTATNSMTPRELHRWRRSLFSVYVGNLPCNMTKKELVQLFSEVGNVQDAHLQAGKSRGFTFGFVRFLTFDECHDAISTLHKRVLGNKAITVEYAAETKDKLEGKKEKDRLLKDDYPRVEPYHRMSDAEAQEKMMLWKLRSSVSRQMPSARGTDKAIVTMEQESSEEIMMNKIQEIVKKVSCLPSGICAETSGAEVSEHSPWILRELNRKDQFISETVSRSPNVHNISSNRDDVQTIVSGVALDKHLEEKEVSSQNTKSSDKLTSRDFLWRSAKLETESRELDTVKNSASHVPLWDFSVTQAGNIATESIVSELLAKENQNPENLDSRRIQCESDTCKEHIKANTCRSGGTIEDVLSKEERMDQVTQRDGDIFITRERLDASRFPDHEMGDTLDSNNLKEAATGMSVPLDKHLIKNDDCNHSNAVEDPFKESCVIPSMSLSPNTSLESASGIEMNLTSQKPFQDCHFRESNVVKPLKTISPEKSDLKRIQRENDSLRQNINWNRPEGITEGALSKEERDSLKAQIHTKEVQLQKEKEITLARKAEQEILYEREKLEAAFDPQLQKELEREKKLREIKTKVGLAKLSNELLKLYLKLNGTKES